MSNLSPDWDEYYITCECGYRGHMSEGGHDCVLDETEPTREWLKNSGYKYDGTLRTWSKLLSRKVHIASRKIVCKTPWGKEYIIHKGQSYHCEREKLIDDVTGRSWYKVYRKATHG